MEHVVVRIYKCSCVMLQLYLLFGFNNMVLKTKRKIYVGWCSSPLPLKEFWVCACSESFMWLIIANVDYSVLSAIVTSFLQFFNWRLDWNWMLPMSQEDTKIQKSCVFVREDFKFPPPSKPTQSSLYLRKPPFIVQNLAEQNQNDVREQQEDVCAIQGYRKTWTGFETAVT